MRKILYSFVLSGLLAVGGSAVLAQSAQPAPGTSQEMQGMHGRHADPVKQASHLAKKLQLNADQQSRIQPILANRQQQMQALHQDQSMSREDRMAKMKSLRDDTNAQIEAVLTDTQKQKFEQMQAKQQQHWQQRKQGDQNSAPTNSPS